MKPENGNYRKYTSKNPLMKLAINRFMDDVVSLAISVDPKAILDAGCGEGFVIDRLRDKNIVGMDISRRALNIAVQNHQGIALACGNVYSMPFKPGTFDLVMVLEVLEHLKSPEQAMIEAGRLSGRYCIFSVPDEPYFRIANLARGKNVSQLGNDAGHINHWGKKAFLKLVSKNFNVIQARKPFPWTVVLCEKR